MKYINRKCNRCQAEKHHTEFVWKGNGYINLCLRCRQIWNEFEEYTYNLFKCGIQQCSQCHDFKSLDEFTNRDRPRGKDYRCKSCEHKRRINSYLNKREHELNRNKRWKQNNLERFNEIRATRMRDIRKNDLSFHIYQKLSGAVHRWVLSNHKSERTLKLLGCSMDFFIKYLEKQFNEGMSWKNCGRNGWEIEHILPCCLFDFTDIKQQEVCFGYKNLRPLWGKDNLIKSDWLDNGYRARNLTPQEKLEYLKSKGHDFTCEEQNTAYPNESSEL